MTERLWTLQSGNTNPNFLLSSHWPHFSFIWLVGSSHHPVCCLHQTLESVYNRPNLPVLPGIFSISSLGPPVLVPHSFFSDPLCWSCKQPPHLNLAWVGIHSLLQGSSKDPWGQGPKPGSPELQADSLLSSHQENPASLWLYYMKLAKGFILVFLYDLTKTQMTFLANPIF